MAAKLDDAEWGRVMWGRAFVGIDPDKNGGLAVVGTVVDGDDDIFYRADTMPTIPGPRKRYDLPAIWEWFHSLGGFCQECGCAPIADNTIFVTLENQQALPKNMGGAFANFARGQSMGFEWMLAALKIPYVTVSPRKWQNKMLEGAPGDDTKQRAAQVVGRLWPGAELKRTPRSRRMDAGLCDALLIAEFGRRFYWLPKAESEPSRPTRSRTGV